MISPLFLESLAEFDVSWPLLANVGQTYDAVAALVTTLALLGVVGSLIMQARDVHVARLEGRRASHRELVRMALDDPVYRRAWAVSIPGADQYDRTRQHMYINLVVSFWGTGLELGTISEEELHYEAMTLFDGEAGRRYWKVARDIRIRTAEGPQRRFVRIMEAAYVEALSAGPPAVPSEDPASAATSPVSRDRERLTRVALGAAGAVTLVALGAVAGRMRRR
ncbi:hypothetical protein GCM10023194_31480 [Planotetraspora phitsanulokensis]|uniref:Uncharacterized protein n=2 Tax=Planotetraspora phitsanulokensis TaxID=575192 RepID=A0A8J3U436_9ACTN|nr:hypothetical protein Pph01_07170 [Planotetraspora phitsanulokensis]